MNATRETPKFTPEWLEESRRQKERNMTQLMGELMDRAGIESLEELHRRFVETEYAYIPVPALHRGKPVSFNLFKRIATGTDRFVYREFVLGLCDVLSLDDDDALDLMWTHMLGERRPAGLRIKRSKS